MCSTFACGRSRTIPVLLAFFVLKIFLFAQDLPTAKPESVGLSSERLERISDAVQQDIDGKRIAGGVTLIVRHGKVAWFKAQGMQDREASKAMPTDAMFRICSMSKPITTVAAMMLYEEGKFLLDDPVSKYLPEFKDMKVLVKPAEGPRYTIPAAKEITIRDLMRHTSGLTYNWNEDLGAMYEKANVASGLLQYDGTIADSTRNIAALPLLFNPGDRFEYSLSVDVLGRLIEVWSGKPLDEFFRTRIFEPLGMKDTYFFVPENKESRLATAYTYYPEQGLNRFPDTPIREGTFVYGRLSDEGTEETFLRRRGPGFNGDGLCAFLQMMLDEGKFGNTRLLSRKTVEIMTHDQLGKIGPDQGFGLGFGIDGVKKPLSELGSVGAYNWGGFFYTAFSIDPKEQMIVVFMAQLHPTGGLELDRQVHELAYQAIND